MNKNFKNIIASKFNSDILDLISELNSYADKSSCRLFFIGGLVRDLIMGVDVSDIDILVEGSAIDFCNNCDICEIISVHNDFGTVKTKVRGYDIDFASTRCEDYPVSGCLPNVAKIGVPLEEDVKRRDFTVNAIALSLSNFQLVDYFGGLDDIQTKKLRILHKNSFLDDPTRILRGLDFSIRFGFEFDEDTSSTLCSYLDKASSLRDGMSLSRVELTLDKILPHGEVAYNAIIANNYHKIFRDDAPCIPSSRIVEASKIFSVPYSNLAKFVFLNSLNAPEANLSTDYNIYQAFKKYSDFELALFYTFDIYPDCVLKYYNSLKNITLDISGVDLITLGYKQGKIIGDILAALLEYRINSNKLLSKEEQIAYVLNNFKK